MKFKAKADRFPYMFLQLNFPDDVIPGLIDLMAELGVKSVAALHVAHEFGLQHIEVFAPLLKKTGIKLAVSKSYQPGPTDLSPLLKSAKAANVDAVIVFSYPVDTFLSIDQAISLDYSPKLMFVGVGSTWAVMKKKFGDGGVEGIMVPGGWVRNLNPQAEDFYDKWVTKYGYMPDMWGGGYGYSSLQILEQAIEKVGFEDREKLRDTIAAGGFKTVLGTIKYDGQFNKTQPGQVGQWQNGEVQLVAPPKSRTASPIYPKPPWPKK